MTPKVAVVTGAASGIGRATVAQLASRGVAHVVLVDRDRAALDQAVAELADDRDSGDSGDSGDSVRSVHGVPADLRAADEIDGWMTEVDTDLGGIDLLINNAAVLGGQPSFPASPLASTAAVIDVNFLAVVVATQAALRLMSGRGGAVLNIVSASAFNPYPEEAVYASTKAAVVHFTRCCAQLHPTTGVRVSAFAPPLTDTHMFRDDDGQMPGWLGERIAEGAALHPPDEVGRQIAEFALRPDVNGKIGRYEPRDVPGDEPGGVGDG